MPRPGQHRLIKPGDVRLHDGAILLVLSAVHDDEPQGNLKLWRCLVLACRPGRLAWPTARRLVEGAVCDFRSVDFETEGP